MADKYLLMILLIGVKKARTKKWLQLSALSMEEWHETVQRSYTVEKLTFALRVQSETFEKWCSIWTRYIGP